MDTRISDNSSNAFNTAVADVVYDSDKQAFALLKDDTQLDLEAESRKQTFIKTVDSYNADARRHGSMEMDIHAGYTWDDVLSVQRGIMEEREVERSRGSRGFWRSKLRRFGGNSESFQAWLKLLPTESHYLSVLCGGLTLILSAAHRMAEIRESILDVINDIPMTLSRAQQYIDVFADFPKLHKCSANLYVAILDTLIAIVREYQKHTARRLSSAAFRQSMSGKELMEKIKAVDACGKHLADQANISLMQRQKQMHECEKDLTKVIISSTRKQDRGFNTIALNQRNVFEILQSQDMRLENLESLVESRLESLNQSLVFLTASPPPSVNPLTGMSHFTPGNISDVSEKQRSRSVSPSLTLEHEQNRRQLAALLDKLNVDHHADIATRDTLDQLRLIYTLSSASQDRAVVLITSSEIETWLTCTSSCALLINGQMLLCDNEARHSPLTYFCAKLVESILARSPSSLANSGSRAVVVRWFCGQHTNMQTDPDGHPPGMLNNLLSQLIHQLLRRAPRLTLGKITTPDRDLELSDLCHLFVLLVEAFPAGTILFCILDGISYYEDAERQVECMEAMSMLASLVNRSHNAINGALVKLLITAPLRSHHVQRLFKAEEVLNMNENYPSKGGFSALQWDVGIGRVIHA